MTSNDMNIAMKFTADVNRAKANIEQLNAELKASGEIAKEANSQTANSYRDIYKAQNEAMNRGAKAAAEQEKQAEMQKAAAKAAEVHKKEVDKLRQGLDRLLGSIDPATKGLGRLDELESKLRKSKKEGLIDNDSFNDYLGKINNQRAALATVDSLNQGTKKLSMHTKTARQNVITMVRAFATGNMTTASNNLLEVGNATGKLPPLFSAAALSAAAFGAVAFGVYKVISSIITEQERFNLALSTTGNYAGTTAAGLESISKSIGKINHNYSETRRIIGELAASGRLSASSIKSIGTAAAYMSAATGKSSQEAVGHFKNIEKSITSWALESNKQYHFLNLATYNRIAALEAQGKTEEAIALATEEYTKRMKESLDELKERENWLEGFWRKIKEIGAAVGEGIKAGFKSSLNLNDLNEDIAELETIKKRGFMVINDGQTVDWNESFEKGLQNLYAKRKNEEQEAELKAHNKRITESATDAQKVLSELWQQNRSDLDKQADAVENVRKQYQALWADAAGQAELKEKGVSSIDGQTFSGGQYDKDIKAITDKGLVQYNEQLSKSLALEKERTTLSKVQFELTEGKFKNASEQEKAIAVSLAKQVDALKAKQALEKQSAENSKINQNLQTQLNKLLVGANSEAEVDAWYNNLLEQFRKTGNQKGIDLIDQLLPLKKADAQLKTIASKINQIRTQQAIREQSIQAQVTSNMITQIEAQAQLVKLHKATAQELAEYLPLLEKMAEKPGEVGIAGQKAAAQLKLEMAELNQTTNVLTNALRSGLQNGIQSGLEGLARGTYTLSDAVSNLGQSIASSMAQIASQGLTDIMMSGLDKLGGALTGSDADSAIDTATSTIAATEMNTAITTAAGIGGTTFNTAITAGATAGAAELNASISTASTVGATEMNTTISTALSLGSAEMGTSLAAVFTTATVELTSSLSASFITGAATLAAAITTASAAASLSGAVAGAGGAAVAAAATGGYISGPGTSTSDSIPARLSNGEYVVKADAVKKYGVDYLHAINTGRLHHYASGGAVTHTRTPSAPKFDDERADNRATSQVANPVIQQTLVIDSGDMLSSGISSLTGSRSMMTWIRSNRATLKQVLS